MTHACNSHYDWFRNSITTEVEISRKIRNLEFELHVN
jgi:hypothetical protein